MPDHDPQQTLTALLAEDMPPAPSDSSLEHARVRAIAEGSSAAVRSRSRRPVWRFASVAVAGLAVAAVAFGVLLPRAETAAFASEQAADALLMQVGAGKALHIVMRYTETGWNEKGGHDARFDLDQTWQTWVDPAGKRSREEFTNNGDDTLDNLSVRNGDHVMVFANNVRHGTGAKPQLIDEANVELPLQTAVGTSIDYIRARIADGTAKATGSKTIDGEEYWIVEWTQDGEAGIGDEIRVTVTMRKSDYRLKTWAQDVTYKNGDGKGVQKERFYVDTIETVDLESLPAGTFDFESVTKLVPPGVEVDKR